MDINVDTNPDVHPHGPDLSYSQIWARATVLDVHDDLAITGSAHTYTQTECDGTEKGAKVTIS